ncbi:EAL domain-containing protein [Stutzerimonas stutzeri]|uniref:bifunctional diguanylate cyclase/phosphodiesterase n=1 Tax=Stutzerimonas sp. S1 TaxID=3030652 RepID=UPI0022253A12|nr:EAL domain-containing protein [Stutzerimonas sp. S1]MCW3150292.1 EAL domain-containing protein [Stutzerimonas sp. S1]
MPAASIRIDEDRPRALATFARRIIPGMLGLLVCALLGAAIAVGLIAARIDRDALAQSHFLAGKAIEAQREWMSRSVIDYAFWGDAYAHLNGKISLDWAYEQANFGPSLYQDFGYEGLLVVTPQGGTAYAVIQGELQPIDARQWLTGGLDLLIARARTAFEEEQGAVGLLSANGTPAMVAAAVLSPGDSKVQAVEGPASVVLFVDLLDSAHLGELGESYAIDALRLHEATRRRSAPQLALALEDGTPVALTWTPAQPGRLILWIALPILGLVALGLGVLAWLLSRQALRSVQLMETSYERLASNRRALAASEARFRDVAEAASDWIWETDAQARLTYLSRRFKEITGHDPDAWVGRPLIELLISDHAALRDWLQAPQAAPLKCSYRAADSCERYCRLAARAIRDGGELRGYRGTASDITEETKAQARVQYLSQHDALTGLPNRARMRDHLENKLASLSNPESRLTVLYLDLDRFKPVNDTLGHAAGDEVLIGVAQRLKQCIRDDDLVARLGGDEFVMVLSRLGEQDDIARLCERVIAAIGEPFFYEGNKVYIGTSIGVATAPTDGRLASELLRCADIALYQAKTDGRGTWRAYSRELDQRPYDRHRQEDDLRRAIAEQQFEIYYQPRYRSEGLRINGAEALLRWRHPERGLLLPEAFIPLAEEVGVIALLGGWVLRQACREATTWPGQPVVSVNLSPLQLRHDRFLDEVKAALAESGLPAARLELEITESALLQENDDTLALLGKLKALGVRLAMDDFGTGYSSLSNLRNYPFDVIKIDNSFVGGIQQNAEDHSIVRALIDLGRGLNLEVTAEGVETAEQLRLLQDDGCTEVQGFHMSRPLPVAALHELLARQPEEA